VLAHAEPTLKKLPSLKKLLVLLFQRMRPSPPGNMRSKFIEPESSTAMMNAGVARLHVHRLLCQHALRLCGKQVCAR
jgi:hypothetical protein